jgi:hypothetical protein
LALLSLLIWQGWMTLSLFGPDQPWLNLLDDRPILSGRHPLHLYHGLLGAQALRRQGTLCCFDPAFQAGYPKTPVFDSGSRPGELFLGVAGGDYQPTAYKIGLAVCCLLVPLFLWAAARGAGLGRGAALLATVGGLLVWWGTPCRQLLEAGELDLLLGGLAALLHIGMLVAFHTTARARSWVGLFFSGCLGWFAQPFLFAALLPLTLLYYLSVGAKHRFAWHGGLFAGVAGGVAVNSFWLFDFFSYWWVRAPLRLDGPLLAHRTLHTIWASPLWGDEPDRILAAGLLGAAVIGVAVLNQTHRRPAARLLGFGAAGFLFLALAGIAWDPPARLGTTRLLVPGLWFAVLPAVEALAAGARLTARLTGGPWRGAVLASAVLGAVGLVGHDYGRPFALRCLGTMPLRIGLAPADRAWVETLRSQTTLAARILWEDSPARDTDSHWTALLPILTDRAYVGGLDPEACIEHTATSLSGPNLAGRPLAEWPDVELAAFCKQYNLGWVACQSAAAAARFRCWKEARLVASDVTGQGGWLFRLPDSSFVRKGQATLLQADCSSITLADVVPEADGEVWLSLHHLAGLRASPSRVQVEGKPEAFDSIPFVRLRMRGPVARLTLSWQDR